MEEQEDDSPGIPAWVMTFADLMSLLMCFFVLLLSFSEIDAQKFKQIAGELSKAFGVQRDIAALDIPMGTSPIFDNFSPGKPEPTPVDSVRQQPGQIAERPKNEHEGSFHRATPSDKKARHGPIRVARPPLWAWRLKRRTSPPRSISKSTSSNPGVLERRRSPDHFSCPVNSPPSSGAQAPADGPNQPSTGLRSNVSSWATCASPCLDQWLMDRDNW